MSTDQSLFSIRRHVSEFALAGARLSFAAAIILIPARARLVLVPRRVPAIPADYTDFLLFAADVAVVLMLAFWVISLIVLPRRPSLGPRTIWIPLAGLVLAGFASSVRSYDPLLSVYHAIRLAGLFWFYVFVVNEIRSIRWVLIPVGIQIMIELTVALGQFVAQHSVGLQSVGELYLDPTRHGVSIVAADGIRLLRAYGLSDHPNILGGCLAFGLLLIIPAYVQGKSRWFALAALLPAGPALLVTFSRSAWLAFVVGVLLLILLAFVSRRTISLPRSASLGLAWLLLICRSF